MFTKKIFVVIVLGIIFILCLVSCKRQLSAVEALLLNDNVEIKRSSAIAVFNHEGIKAVANYCKKKREIDTKAGTYLIDCTVTAEFYDPNAKIKVRGNETILPVSMYAQADEVMLSWLDKGWKSRHTCISTFARSKNDYFNPIIKREDNFKE